MKTLLLTILLFITLSCSTKEDTSPSTTTADEWVCGTYNGHQLYTGPKGGCYYKNSNGNKTYVDRSNCSCN